jgi:branched-chain amino acid transport system permease protein
VDWMLLSKFLVNGIAIGALYGLVALCFTLIYKASKVVNFAQGDFLLVGAWLCWMLLVQLKINVFLALVITIGFSAIFGYLIQAIVLRPLIGEPVVSVVMVTVGISIFLQAILKWRFGTITQNFPDVLPWKTVSIGGLRLEAVYVVSTVAAAVLMAGFAWFFKMSKLGLGMRATAYEQRIAASVGIPIGRMFGLAWAISAAVSALAGIIIAMVGGVSPQISDFGLKVFPAVIIGGLDSIIGAVVGGLIVGLLENVSEFVDGQYLGIGNMYVIAPYYILVVALLVRPHGIFGTKDIERV